MRERIRQALKQDFLNCTVFQKIAVFQEVQVYEIFNHLQLCAKSQNLVLTLT